jgi:septal ring factor EnvC (AmiA/AmiB activator)
MNQSPEMQYFLQYILPIIIAIGLNIPNIVSFARFVMRIKIEKEIDDIDLSQRYLKMAQDTSAEVERQRLMFEQTVAKMETRIQKVESANAELKRENTLLKKTNTDLECRVKQLEDYLRDKQMPIPDVLE